MEKYFDIHVTYGEKEEDGYSIFIIANNKEEAKQKAVDKKLFEYEYDVNDIDYIEEITQEDYNEIKKVVLKGGIEYEIMF